MSALGDPGHSLTRRLYAEHKKSSPTITSHPEPCGGRGTRTHSPCGFESEADVRDVIELLRLNDDQVVTRRNFSEEPGA